MVLDNNKENNSTRKAVVAMNGTRGPSVDRRGKEGKRETELKPALPGGGQRRD